MPSIYWFFSFTLFIWLIIFFILSSLASRFFLASSLISFIFSMYFPFTFAISSLKNVNFSLSSFSIVSSWLHSKLPLIEASCFLPLVFPPLPKHLLIFFKHVPQAEKRGEKAWAGQPSVSKFRTFSSTICVFAPGTSAGDDTLRG